MNIYLITSNSQSIIKEEISNIVQNNNVLKFNMEEVSIDELYQELSYTFIIEDKKYIVAKNFFDKTKDDRILKYLENPSEKIVLIFTEDKVDMRKKAIKYIKNNYSLINIQVDYKNVYQYVDKYAKKNGYTLDFGVGKYLVALYNLNIDIIYNELDKVFMYYNKPSKLNYNDVKEIISIPLNNNSFKFVEALVTKNIDKVHSLLEDLITYKVMMPSLIVLVAREYRLMYNIKIFQEKGFNTKDILSEFKLMDWQLKKYQNNASMYSSYDILDILSLLATYDEKIKSGKVDGYCAVQNIITYIITK